MWPETASSETPDDQDNFDEIDVNNKAILKEQDMPEAFVLTVNYNILVFLKKKTITYLLP
jgi:hypothetical protein